MNRWSRADESLFGRWWWSIDRTGLAILALLMMIGSVVLIAAGPTAAARLGIQNQFYFPLRQMVFAVPALILVLFVSFLSPLQTRRLGVLTFLGALLLMAATLIFSADINGAKRWLDLGPVSLQPSEFAKPGFVIAAAWMLAEGANDHRFPGGAIALGAYAVLAGLLLLQPDFGQWALVTAAWAVMFFIAGWSWAWIGFFATASVAGLTAGYFLSAHVARRIDGFLNPQSGENYQVDRSVETVANGSFFGRGDAPALKGGLPDAHTDFVFAVAVEEFGFVLGALIIALFAAFVARTLAIAAGLRSLFAQCAVAGLAAMIGLQAMINIAVSLRAMPAKGMTLPLVSYGGSSLLATALSIGFIIALTRADHGVAAKRKDIMP
ncbi:MAG: putative peptidoglycan glycosyltransferase FtsW [Pseudomonadota bacterium]